MVAVEEKYGKVKCGPYLGLYKMRTFPRYCRRSFFGNFFFFEPLGIGQLCWIQRVDGVQKEKPHGSQNNTKYPSGYLT